MAITAEQKKSLEAAGYTVSGQTVKNKDGGSVGGYNENGNIWSGSSKVRGILKSKPAPKADVKAAPKKAAPKAAPKKSVVDVAKAGLDKADIKSGASRSTANKVRPSGGKPKMDTHYQPKLLGKPPVKSGGPAKSAKAPSKAAAATGPQRPPRADAPPSPPKVGKKRAESFSDSFARTPLARGMKKLFGSKK